MDIIVVNRSALISAQEIAPVLSAINDQISRDFEPYWGTPGTLHLESGPESTARFYLQDSIDDPNALGYHVDQNGVISGIIDVKTCVALNNDWRIVLGHETLETLTDPYTTRIAPDGITSVEVCDPVEESFYTVGEVPLANFVTPTYYGFNSDTHYDFMQRLRAGAPTLGPGGYISRLRDGKWVSTFGMRRGFMASRENGRRAWRESLRQISAESARS